MNRDLCPNCLGPLDSVHPSYTGPCAFLHPSRKDGGCAQIVYDFVEGKFREWTNEVEAPQSLGEMESWEESINNIPYDTPVTREGQEARLQEIDELIKRL